MILLEGWARDGLTDEQIAHNMGISTRTLYRWKKKSCQICQALKKGKEVADREVENALFKRAVGYDYTETRTEEKNGVITKKTITTKHIPGDTTAMIFWLKNRKPEVWKANDVISVPIEAEKISFYLPEKDRIEEESEE